MERYARMVAQVCTGFLLEFLRKVLNIQGRRKLQYQNDNLSRVIFSFEIVNEAIIGKDQFHVILHTVLSNNNASLFACTQFFFFLSER